MVSWKEQGQRCDIRKELPSATNTGEPLYITAHIMTTNRDVTLLSEPEFPIK